MLLTNKSNRTVSLTLRAGFALAAALLLAGPADAATATNNMTVGATVTNNCTIAASTLTFGAYDPVSANASADLDVDSTVSVTCTSGATTAITLGQGLNADTGSTDAAPLRRMASGANHLSYNIFTTTGRTAVWGNTAGTAVAHTGTGSAVAVDVFGRITAAQNVPAGTYADTVVATITF